MFYYCPFWSYNFSIRLWGNTKNIVSVCGIFGRVPESPGYLQIIQEKQIIKTYDVYRCLIFLNPNFWEIWKRQATTNATNVAMETCRLIRTRPGRTPGLDPTRTDPDPFRRILRSQGPKKALGLLVGMCILLAVIRDRHSPVRRRDWRVGLAKTIARPVWMWKQLECVFAWNGNRLCPRSWFGEGGCTLSQRLCKGIGFSLPTSYAASGNHSCRCGFV